MGDYIACIEAVKSAKKKTGLLRKVLAAHEPPVKEFDVYEFVASLKRPQNISRKD